MDNRTDLMVTSAMFLLVGLKGEDSEVEKAVSCVREFGDMEEMSKKYKKAAALLVKHVKEMCE